MNDTTEATANERLARAQRKLVVAARQVGAAVAGPTEKAVRAELAMAIEKARDVAEELARIASECDLRRNREKEGQQGDKPPAPTAQRTS